VSKLVCIFCVNTHAQNSLWVAGAGGLHLRNKDGRKNKQKDA